MRKRNYGRTVMFIVVCVICFVSSVHSQDITEIYDKGIYHTLDGEAYTYIKRITRDAGSIVFQKGKNEYTLKQIIDYELELYEKSWKEEIVKLPEQFPDKKFFDITVFLKKQPSFEIAYAIRRKKKPYLDKLIAQAQEITGSILPQSPLTPEEESAFINTIKKSKNLYTKAQLTSLTILREQIEEQYNIINNDILKEIVKAVSPDHKAMTDFINSLGGSVTGNFYSVSGMHAHVPAKTLSSFIKNDNIASIFIIPEAVMGLDTSTRNVNADVFWNLPINGAQWDAGIIDSGIQIDHPTFSNITGFYSSSGNTDLLPKGHGTGVASIIVGNDPTYLGMAFGVQRLFSIYGLDTVNLFTNIDWMFSQTAVPDVPEIINMSMGVGMFLDMDYTGTEQYLDSVCSLWDCLFSICAGNFEYGFQTIWHPTGAYNCLSVGGMWEGEIINNRQDDIAYLKTCRGPTLNERKKPDISAPGEFINFANKLWADNPGNSDDFKLDSGTSLAAPHVTGAALLVMDYRNSTSAKATKALLINSADAWSDNNTPFDRNDDGPATGSLWNSTYGWGYLNLSDAFLYSMNVFEESLQLTTNRSDFYRGFLYTNQKATLVWNRNIWSLVGFVDLLSDLDLFVYNANGESLIESSNSLLDNVEQVSVPSSGEVIIQVKYTRHNSSSVTEDYALAIDKDFEQVLHPICTLKVTCPSTIHPGESFLFSIDITNTGGVPALNTTVYIETDQYLSVESKIKKLPNPVIDRIEPGETIQVPHRWELICNNASPVPSYTTLGFKVVSKCYFDEFTYEIDKIIHIR